MKYLALFAALVLPLSAHAAGGGDETAPSAPKCEKGQVYDKTSKTCVDADSATDPDLLYDTVRRLAYAGRLDEAQDMLALMPPRDDRRLTYLGFTHRKLGRTGTARVYYRAALAANPDNILARSYMAQGFVEAGRVADAIAELREIRARGGAGSWAEASLRTAIATGRTFDY